MSPFSQEPEVVNYSQLLYNFFTAHDKVTLTKANTDNEQLDVWLVDIVYTLFHTYYISVLFKIAHR